MSAKSTARISHASSPAVQLDRGQAEAESSAAMLDTGWCHACDRPVASHEPCGCYPGSAPSEVLHAPVVALARFAGMPEDAIGSVRSNAELLCLVARWLEGQACDDDPCPGQGRCHGPRSWCEWCGDVDRVCDDITQSCDSHFGNDRWCYKCGSQHPFDEPCEYEDPA